MDSAAESSDDETIRLLREIRDIRREYLESYRKYVADSRSLEKETNALRQWIHEYRSSTSFADWILLLLLTAGLGTLALVALGQIVPFAFRRMESILP